jgi:hypothetical protein
MRTGTPIGVHRRAADQCWKRVCLTCGDGSASGLTWASAYRYCSWLTGQSDRSRPQRGPAWWTSRVWEAPSIRPYGLGLLLGRHRHRPVLSVWMTAADRCLGHAGDTADEDDAARSLAEMAPARAQGEQGPGDACRVGKGRRLAAAELHIRSVPGAMRGPPVQLQVRNKTWRTKE